MKKDHLNASINVTGLLKEPLGSTRSLEISGKLGEEVEGSVEGNAKLTRISQGVLAQCEFEADVKLVCSRCLGAFVCPVSFRATEEFFTISDVSGGEQLSSSGRSEDFAIDDKNVLDLSELIRQYVLLNLPMKPLCRPDCPGVKEDNPNATTA